MNEEKVGRSLAKKLMKSHGLDLKIIKLMNWSVALQVEQKGLFVHFKEFG